MDGKPLISFDYAIKYLVKDKGDYEIVEGFISSLLKSQGEGYKDVKIIALLDTESNQEDSMQKRSLADVIVEDEDHRKYIIEIERNVQRGFIHKACFNTSRLIVDHLSHGIDFHNIIKVFHISILYFPVGNEPIHHGQTIISGLESKEKLTVHIKDPVTHVVTDATDILPEYFFISIPLFDDRLKNEMDAWLYVMKHDDIPKNFHSPYMEKVKDKLAILKMTTEERNNYFAYQKQVRTDQDSLDTAREEGVEKGVEIGMEKKARDNAKNLIRMGLPLNQVSRGTELSIEIVEKLAEELKNEDKRNS